MHFYELSLATQAVAEQCEAVKGDSVVFNCLKASNNCSAEVGLLIFWAAKADNTLISAKKHMGTDVMLGDDVTKLAELSLRSQAMIGSIGRHHLLDRRARSEDLRVKLEVHAHPEMKGLKFLNGVKANEIKKVQNRCEVWDNDPVLRHRARAQDWRT